MTAEAATVAAGGLTPASPPSGVRHRLAFARWLVPLAPATVLLVLFFAGPILWCVYAAFTNAALSGVGASSASFTGLANFRHMIADPQFRQSVVLTIVFVLGSAVVGQNMLGLLLAVLMRRSGRLFRAVLGTIVVTAWVVPEVVAAFIWYAFLSQGGSLNTLLGPLGVPNDNWLYSAPMISVIIANVWRGTAFSMLVYQAALSDVPPDLLGAAAVDGAEPWQQFVHITLPLIRRSILTNLMLITLQTLSLFTLVFAMTGGGPGTESQILPVYMYQQAFKFYQLGYGAAVALVLLAIGAIFSLGYVRLLKVET